MKGECLIEKDNKKICCRVFHISSDLEHTSEETIKSALAHKTIRRWGYILHDKDVYLDEDVKKGKCTKEQLGQLKKPHWHIIGDCPNDPGAECIAKWFEVPTNFVDIPKGRGAFLDCVEYLTHENLKQQELGKYLYPDEEVKSNFDFRGELTERATRMAKYGRDLDAKKRMLYDVLYCGKTLRECIEEDKILYMDNLDKLKKFRLEYISRQKAPSSRVNYYICGSGGIGKGLMSRAIARSLFPNLIDDEDIYFSVGGDNVNFDGYDGQPVIIWNDHRAVDLLRKLGGRGNVFDVFDTHPPQNASRQHVKHNSVKLCNVVNIVNGVEDYSQFLDALSGEYVDKKGILNKAEDKGQSYRRFPLIIPIHREDFDILINRGFMEDNDNFFDYIEYKNIRGNLQKIAVVCGQREDLAKRLTEQTIKPITDKHKEILAKFEQNNSLTDEEILEQFKDYGTIQQIENVTIGEVKEENKDVDLLDFMNPDEDYSWTI